MLHVQKGSAPPHEFPQSELSTSLRFRFPPDIGSDSHTLPYETELHHGPPEEEHPGSVHVASASGGVIEVEMMTEVNNTKSLNNVNFILELIY